MTRGQIHTSGQVARDGTIEIQLGFKVSPSFKVLVYYVNRVGETIADSKTYNVAECFQNKVCFTILAVLSYQSRVSISPE